MKRKPEWPRITEEHAKEIWFVDKQWPEVLIELKISDYIKKSALEEFEEYCNKFEPYGKVDMSHVRELKQLAYKAIKEAEEEKT